MDAPTLEWSAAAVQDGVLTVEVGGDRPQGWKSTFQQTVKLLCGGDWGTVSLKRGKVRVADVPEGAEAELHHFLEAAVQQANATHVEPDDGSDDDPDEPAGDDKGGSDADARMTARFRDLLASLAADGRDAATKAARKRAMAGAVRGVAEVLGNTQAVARRSYIDPRVFDRYLSGWTIGSELDRLGSLGGPDESRRAKLERAVLDLIDDDHASSGVERSPHSA